jgi:DNA-binding HxlR family transcriptional regulator
MDLDLLRALKALSDASRLRIIGLLAERPMAVGELADALSLTPATAVHHLGRLREAGLVEARARRPFVEYSLRAGALTQVGRQLDAAGRAGAEQPAMALGPDGALRPAYDAKVLRACIADGRVTQIPLDEKKRLLLLRYLAESLFSPGERYPKRKVNARLATMHEDVGSLRHYLVGARIMEREAGSYRLTPRETWPA